MYGAIAANKRNTVLIMAVFVGLIGAIGWDWCIGGVCAYTVFCRKQTGGYGHGCAGD